MDYKDFLKYFTSLTVCHARRDWQDARVGLALEFDVESDALKTQAISLSVPAGGEVKWISLYQQDDREENAPKYIDLALLYLKIQEMVHVNHLVLLVWKQQDKYIVNLKKVHLVDN